MRRVDGQNANGAALERISAPEPTPRQRLDVAAHLVLTGNGDLADALGLADEAQTIGYARLAADLEAT